MAERLPAYRGALHAIALGQAKEQQGGGGWPGAGNSSGTGTAGDPDSNARDPVAEAAGRQHAPDTEIVPGDAAVLRTHPAFAGLVKVTQV